MVDTIRFQTYSQFHGKTESVGSTFIRVDQLIKYWPEAELYKYGEFPDVLIFQKVFCSDDYKFPKNFENIKIADICDPVWLEGFNVVEMCQAMDAVTVPTEVLARFIRQFHSNVHVVPDRFDLEVIPEPKKHEDKAEVVVWFGYAHNSGSLKAAVNKINELGLKLIIISNDNPIHTNGVKPPVDYTFIKYNEATIYEDIQKADFALLPVGHRPEDQFKSNNKTVKANLAGLPVATTAEDMELYMKPENRRKWYDTKYEDIRSSYDCKKSVEQMKQIIYNIKHGKEVPKVSKEIS